MDKNERAGGIGSNCGLYSRLFVSIREFESCSTIGPCPHTLVKGKCRHLKFCFALPAIFAQKWKRIPQMITIAQEDPRSPDVQRLLSAFVDEVKKRYDSPPADVGIFDPELVQFPEAFSWSHAMTEMRLDAGRSFRWMTTSLRSNGCLSLQRNGATGLPPRSWTNSNIKAREFDYDAMRLETGVRQPESIALYGKAGFYRIPNFPPFEDDSSAVCFEKRI